MIDRKKSLCDFTDEELKVLGDEIIARLKASEDSPVAPTEQKELEVIFPNTARN